MYYAEVIDGKVTRVLVVEGTVLEATRWLRNNVSKNRWVKTCDKGSFRNKYAGVGDEYHKELNAFIPKKKYASWILNEEKFEYEPPIAKPSEGNYDWDEDIKKWKLIEDKTQ